MVVFCLLAFVFFPLHGSSLNLWNGHEIHSEGSWICQQQLNHCWTDGYIMPGSSASPQYDTQLKKQVMAFLSQQPPQSPCLAYPAFFMVDVPGRLALF